MSIPSIAMQVPITQTTTPPLVASSHLATRGAPSEANESKAEAISSSPVTETTAAEQKQQLSDAVKAVKDFIQPRAGNLEFTMDEETGDTVIKIVDTSSGELIRQIPSKEMLEIAKALDRLQGLLVRQKA